MRASELVGLQKQVRCEKCHLRTEIPLWVHFISVHLSRMVQRTGHVLSLQNRHVGTMPASSAIVRQESEIHPTVMV